MTTLDEIEMLFADLTLMTTQRNYNYSYRLINHYCCHVTLYSYIIGMLYNIYTAKAGLRLAVAQKEKSNDRKAFFTHLFQGGPRLPPSLYEVVGSLLRGIRAWGEDDCSIFNDVMVLPWLHRTNEMNNLYVGKKSRERERERERGILSNQSSPT